MAAYLDEHDMPGAMHRGRFDDWYPGFVDHVNNFRNTVSFLTETALYRYATPHFYTIDEFPARQAGPAHRGLLLEPVEGRLVAAGRCGALHARRVDGGAGYGGEESRRAAVRPLSRGPRCDRALHEGSAVRLRHSARAARPADRGDAGGEAADRRHRGASGDVAMFTANGATYKEGDWVVLMDQPFAALVKELFDVQKYPEFRSTGAPIGGAAQAAAVAEVGRWRRGGGGAPAAAAHRQQLPRRRRRQRRRRSRRRRRWRWTRRRGGSRRAGSRRQLLRNSPTTSPAGRCRCRWASKWSPVSKPVERRRARRCARSSKLDPIAGKVEGAGPVFAFSHNSQRGAARGERYSGRGRHGQLRKDRTARFTPPGTSAPILQKDGVDATSLKEAPAAWPVKKPRIGDLRAVGRQHRRGLDPLDPRAVPFPVHACCTTPTCRRGHLRDQFDTIVIAEMGTRQIMDGMQAGHGARPVRRRHRRRRAREALRDFVDAGRHAGHAGQRLACSPSISSTCRSPTSLAGLRPGSVLLLRLAAARRDQGAESSGGGRAAGRRPR